MEKAKKKLILVTENLKFLTLYLSQKSFNGNLIWIFFLQYPRQKSRRLYFNFMSLIEGNCLW